MNVSELNSIKIKLASPDDILSWSHGEVIKPETINYRTLKPEKDGLFCERIFGPTKDYQCYCGKYRGIRYKGVICDRCGVEVIRASVRRERMGHIRLATPCSHIWFLRGVSSVMGLILGIPRKNIEKVVYFAAYVVRSVSEDKKKEISEKIEKEYKLKLKGLKKELKKGTKKLKEGIEKLDQAKERAEKELLSIKRLKILSEAKYCELSLKYGEIFEASTGAETIRNLLEQVDLSKEVKELTKKAESIQPSIKQRNLLRKLNILKEMQKAGIRPEWMILTVVPVLPPDLRPMVELDGGRYASSDLNDLYRRVINRNNRLKYLLEINAPEVIIRNEKRMLQEALDALIDNGMRQATMTRATTGGKRPLKSLADMVKGKEGRFRQNLLGKRVDYSGRSVIVSGPELKLYQCGLPKKMALELFRPFVIQKILERELAYNVRKASELIEQEVDEVWAIVEEVSKDKLVLLNRAPTLHRLGIQAFQPILTEGEAIRLHPLACEAFNADFDGDQMAVHLPLSKQAQKEARERMFAKVNLLKPATGRPIVSPRQGMVLGCYWLTMEKEGQKGEGKVFSAPEEAILAYNLGYLALRAKIKLEIEPPKVKEREMLETTVGRLIFNQVLPDDYPFWNSQVGAKDLDRITAEIIRMYGFERTQQMLDDVKDLGFEHVTISGLSWGMDDLIVPKEKAGIIKESEEMIRKINDQFEKGLLSRSEKSDRVVEVWTEAKTKIGKILREILPKDGPIYATADSGARGGWTQSVQMAGMKGLVVNPMGRVMELPVKSCYKEGLSALEYFISTHGARKGTVDTALRTSKAGYLTRRLVDVAHDVIIREEDCGDKEGIYIFKKDARDIDQDFSFKISGRISLDTIKDKETKEVIVKKGEIIDYQKAKLLDKNGIEKVRVRSPLSCKTLGGLCQKCYGCDLGRNHLVEEGEAVGIIAAQSIGEPGTQLTLRTFHTGGVAGGTDITTGLPRVDEVFECRVPKGKAVIAYEEGEVIEITEDRVIKVRQALRDTKSKSKKKTKIVEYKIPELSAIRVEANQHIEKGYQLNEGNIDLKELMKVSGEKATKHYIVNEIQRIYVSQGVGIHDKHIEVIVRQMFSRVKVKDAGDTNLVPGGVVEKIQFIKENERVKKKGGKEAVGQPILLRISKVALTTESFLSAASFQQTTQVLIQAALEGREDKLRGLKENVIIGKLIPAGTGFKKKAAN